MPLGMPAHLFFLVSSVCYLQQVSRLLFLSVLFPEGRIVLCFSPCVTVRTNFPTHNYWHSGIKMKIKIKSTFILSKRKGNREEKCQKWSTALKRPWSCDNSMSLYNTQISGTIYSSHPPRRTEPINFYHFICYIIVQIHYVNKIFINNC